MTIGQMLANGRTADQVEAEMLRRHEAQVKALPYEGKMGSAFGVAIKDASTKQLFEELRARGGTAAALAEAALLQLKKSEDYNGSPEPKALDIYFPFGAASYVHMLHVKAQRAVALVKKNSDPNFEGLTDTALDLINYASFLVERLARFESRKGL